MVGGAPFDPAGVKRIRIRISPQRIPRKPLPRREVFDRDGWACVICGRKQDLAVDHILPVSRGGGDEMDNLQTMDRYCNSRKGARIISNEDLRMELFGFRNREELT
jgi:5-methylcytosine-specific restriction endonuclease McrA